MRARLISRQLLSVAAVCLFLFSMLSLDAAPQADNMTIQPKTETSTVSQSPHGSGTYVNWNQDSGNSSNEWTWSNTNWLFGPRPTFKIYHQNGSELTKDSYAEINENLTFQVTVPKNVFTHGGVLGRVSFYGYYMSSNMNFSASFSMEFNAYSYEPWYAYSWAYNSSEGPSPPSPSFLDILPLLCSNSSDANRYYVNFVVRFTAESPIGLFGIDMTVSDNNYNTIGTYNYGSGWEFNGIAVGIPPNQAWSFSYGGTYTLQKLDLEGDPLYSVSRGRDFIMRFNVSGPEPEYVQLGLQIPPMMQVAVEKTGMHREMKVSTGGWVYDTTMQTYIWNATVEVSYYEDVYGPYQSYEYVDVGIYKEVQVYRLYEVWDPELSQFNRTVVLENTWAYRYMMFIYNSSLGFETRLGYTYYGYPWDHYVDGEYNRIITVYEPIPSDYPVFYELNMGLCSVSTLGIDLTVDFVGHFTQLMQQSGAYDYFSFEPLVMGPDNAVYQPSTYGQAPRQTPSDFEMAKRITIERPVTIARLLKEDGTEPRGWLFQVNQGQNFMVKGRLQGGGSLASDIDGAALELEAYSGSWTANESISSHVTYDIVMDMHGNPTLQAFNHTQKYNYTYGKYMDYVYTNITGWHYEYNSSTSTWEWVNSMYWEWRWMEVEGWHWQWWYYNQLTGEWQQNGFDYRSSEAKVSDDFARVTGFASWVDSGDLFVTFLVNMSESVPSTSYWWDFAFLNNTWYEDYSSGYGLHQVLTWDREWVYSFDMGGDKVYVDPFKQNQLAFLNTTLSPDFMRGEETPYIVKDGVQYTVKVIKSYDPWSGTENEEFFFYDHYDPEEGKDYYYYLLPNTTKVLVTYTDAKYIYNVTVNDAEWFLTSMEWPNYWYDYGSSSNYAWWLDLYGAVHYYPDPVSYAAVYHDKVELENRHEYMYLRYGLDGVLNISQFWWESRDGCYYATDMSGSLYRLDFNYTTGEYQAIINSVLQSVRGPMYYFIGEYEGNDVVLAGWGTQRFYYTEDNGVRHEMPYPGANAQWHMDLSRTDNSGGKVPTTKSVIYNGNVYPVYNISAEHYVDIGGQTYRLDMQTAVYGSANGTDIWNPTVLGYYGEYGVFDDNMFLKNGTVTYNSGMDGWVDSYWDGEAYQYYADLVNGTRWLLNRTGFLTVFERNYNGSSLFTTRTYPEFRSVGNETWYEYVALNGSLYNSSEYRILDVLNSFTVEAYNNGSADVFEFMGDVYVVDAYVPVFWSWKITNSNSTGGPYFFMNSNRPVYEFQYRSTTVTAAPNFENIYRVRNRWGYASVYGPAPIASSVYKNFYNLIIGMPDWGMWGLKNWDTNPDNGALDLDGNLDTVDDQYFVEQEYSSRSTSTHEWDFMSVWLDWDPNSTLPGDEMHINSYLGLSSFTWSYEWNQTFYWYHAADITPLNASEMQDVKDIVLSSSGTPMPGYWDIAWMCKNVTWADLVAEAIANGWDWMTSNTQTWTWLTFAINQDYGTSYQESGVDYWMNVGLHYEFSGLMLWEDENNDGLMNVDLNNPSSGELTHYLIPDHVDSVSFVTPGAAYGNLNASGSIVAGVEDELTYGISFRGVNGTVYPFNLYGYWGWYDRQVTGADLRTFDERPTKVTIDELSFLVHFQGHLNSTSLNNYATIKVDNYVGNWDVDMLGGRSNLVNKSLALNYLADIRMSSFAFKANGSFTGSESTVSSDVFEMETAGAKFAEMVMGGTTYDWSKNTSAPYEVVSQTTPMGTFRTAFESESGQSATAWSFTSSMYYVTIGFPEWQGYSVYQDPVFISYVSGLGTSSIPSPVTFSQFSQSPMTPGADDYVEIGVDIDSQYPISSVRLEYWTSGSAHQSVPMNNVHDMHWSGQIPAHPLGTTVFYKVIVETESGPYESSTRSYVVGGTTTSTSPWVPGPGVPLDVLVMVVGVASAALIIVLLVLRRRK
ncbi:MAG: hypothetical protein HXY34_05445 [Candidatus Thorarchaeota archaeon]|nr:hypothetical protein [Candidatus Thorarchaeota archaeon]